MRKECEQHHTPARDNQYRATARYYVDSCPYCKIEQLQSQLRLLAEAVLVAHSDYCDYCPYTMSEPGCKAAGCNDGQGCQCEACKLAREVLSE